MQIIKKTAFMVAAVGLLWSCRSSQNATFADKITTPITANITNEKFIDCFPEGLSMAGKPVWCEASAILFDGKKILVANDKPMPEGSSVFSYNSIQDLENKAKATYSTDKTLTQAIKFEDFSLTPDKKFVFLTTAFDRVKDGSTEWDGYNTLLYWENKPESTPKVLSIENGAATSVKLRSMISKVLGNVPYFKIEGMAATNDKLYFGIREEGNKFDDFRYVSKIIAISYKTNGSNVSLSGDFELVSDINIAAISQELTQKGLAISSIEFDAKRKYFWILTSFEVPATGGSAYLWRATLNDLKNNKMELIKSAPGQALVFNHKAEDMTFLSSNKLLVIHDDDRGLSKVGNATRKPHQAAYSIVELK